MEFFKNLKTYLRWLGILPYSSDSEATIFIFALNCTLFGLYISYFAAPLWYILSTTWTFKELTETSFYLLSGLLTILWYSVCVWQKSKFGTIFIDLEKIMAKRKQSGTISKIYDETNVRIETISKKLHNWIGYVIVPILTQLPIAISFIKYFSSDYSNESFQQIYPARYPFDWKTPSGYILCAFIQTVTQFVAGEIFVVVLILVAGFCLLAKAFILDIGENLFQFSQDVNAAGAREHLSLKEQIEMKKKLCGIIEFHSVSIWFINNFSSSSKSLILVFFLYTTMSICSLFLQINMLFEAGHIGRVLAHTVIIASPVTFWLFLFCNFGHQVTECFCNVDHAFYGLEWYELPLDMQKCIGMAITLAHKEIYLRGFGSTILCTRDAFKQILKTTFSYFMVLKQFSE